LNLRPGHSARQQGELLRNTGLFSRLDVMFGRVRSAIQSTRLLRKKSGGLGY
jgi:hypothetical protein